MTLTAAPGKPIEASVDNAATGLVGTIGVRIRNPATATDVLARTTAGITEQPAGSGVYFVNLTAPNAQGTYSVIWDNGSGVYANEDLLVSYSAPNASVPSGTDLCTVADVRADLTFDVGTNTSWDSLIQTYITAASAALCDEVSRELAPTGTATRRFAWDAEEGDTLDLAPYDLRALSGAGVVLHPEQASPLSLTSDTDYFLTPVGAPPPQGTYLALVMSGYLGPRITSQTWVRAGFAYLDVTGSWGPAAVTATARQACVVTVSSWLRQSKSPGSQASDDPRAFEPGRFNTYAVPSAAKRLLVAYYRAFAV